MYLVDSNEKKSKIPKMLNSLNIKTELTPLPVGDYVVIGQIIGCVESKSAEDYISSIENKQIEKELFNMCYNHDRSVLAIHGNILEALFARKMKRETLFNFMAGAVVKTIEEGAKGTISIVNFMSIWDFVMFLKTFHNHIVSDDIRREYLTKKFKPTSGMEKEFTIQSYPKSCHIGPKRAKELKKEFGTIKNLVNADMDDLIKIRGIGKKMAGEMYRHVNEE